jgi:putative addiction module CopG family antidote
MNVSLGKQLEALVEEQVKTGIYQNQSEVVRDALRHMFIHDDSDDTERLAEQLIEARKSPRNPYRRGGFRKRAAQAIALKRRQARTA